MRTIVESMGLLEVIGILEVNGVLGHTGSWRERESLS